MNNKKQKTGIERLGEIPGSSVTIEHSLGMRINPATGPNWNQEKSKHVKVSVVHKVYNSFGEEKVHRLFRGSRQAFSVWKLSHQIPATAEVVTG